MIIEGNIIKIAGPVIVADGMRGAQMLEMVRVGDEKLIGEIIELEGDTATIQVYEETAGIQPGEVVECTGGALSVELGPGIMSSIYDGIQRPLRIIREESGDFIARGIDVDSIDKEKKWTFEPIAKVGDKVVGGDVLGQVQETSAVLQKIMVPPMIEGTIKSIAAKAEYTVLIKTLLRALMRSFLSSEIFPEVRLKRSQMTHQAEKSALLSLYPHMMCHGI